MQFTDWAVRKLPYCPQTLPMFYLLNNERITAELIPPYISKNGV